jgi:hypothetical protein
MHRECERLARIGAGRMPAFPDVRLQLMSDCYNCSPLGRNPFSRTGHGYHPARFLLRGSVKHKQAGAVVSTALTPLAPLSQVGRGGYPEGVVRHAALTPLAPLSQVGRGGYPGGVVRHAALTPSFRPPPLQVGFFGKSCRSAVCRSEACLAPCEYIRIWYKPYMVSTGR